MSLCAHALGVKHNQVHQRHARRRVAVAVKDRERSAPPNAYMHACKHTNHHPTCKMKCTCQNLADSKAGMQACKAHSKADASLLSCWEQFWLCVCASLNRRLSPTRPCGQPYMQHHSINMLTATAAILTTAEPPCGVLCPDPCTGAQPHRTSNPQSRARDCTQLYSAH